MSVKFDEKGQIPETIYSNDSTNPSYKTRLRPALDWLKQISPEELDAIYQNNWLVKPAAAAGKWKELLTNGRVYDLSAHQK